MYQGIHENSDITHLASSNIVLMWEDFYSRAVTKQNNCEWHFSILKTSVFVVLIFNLWLF